MIGNPLAWAHMGKGLVLKERGKLDAAATEIETALRISVEAHDPETESWVLGMQAMVRGLQGDTEGACAIARHGYEVAERLGDAFSRSVALSNLAWTEIEAGDFESALESIEEADRLYLGAMGVGGEMEGWRGSVRAEALRGLGRTDEALAAAERAVEASGSRGIEWGGILALLALGRARGDTGDFDAADETLAEALEMARRHRAIVNMERIEGARRALATGSR